MNAQSGLVVNSCDDQGRVRAGRIDGMTFRRYRSKHGFEIRIYMIRGQHLFCAGDVLESVGRRWKAEIFNRLEMGEHRRLPMDGKSRRFVNCVGLVKLIPQNNLYYLGHLLVIELLQTFIDGSQAKRSKK